MTTSNFPSSPEALEIVLHDLLEKMSTTDPTSDEYRMMVDQLVKLYNLKKIDNELHLKTLEEDRLVQSNIAEQLLKERESAADLRLKDLEAQEKKAELGRRFKVSHDTLAIVVGNLLGIGVVVAYERAHVLTSKAFTNVLKPR